MLGWEVYVFRQNSDPSSDDSEGPLLATWLTSVFGMRWMKELVKEGKAVALSGGGYPDKFSVTAEVLLPIITGDLPSNDSPPVFGDDYFVPENWSGKPDLDNQHILDCSDDEELIVEAWDQS